MNQEMLTSNNNNASKTGSISVYYFVLDFLLKITLISQFKVCDRDTEVLGLIIPTVCVDDQLSALVQGSI